MLSNPAIYIPMRPAPAVASPLAAMVGANWSYGETPHTAYLAKIVQTIGSSENKTCVIFFDVFWVLKTQHKQSRAEVVGLGSNWYTSSCVESGWVELATQMPVGKV